ncbi:hypothetical protein [Halomontanus rarus]|uniref:hypothetical protein n=1 Tax=Halomontanus rarus TaxID=3034020 RepID=UPI00293B9F14|nr:hypothetical protein [Halovivax sp. KZCA124]
MIATVDGFVIPLDSATISVGRRGHGYSSPPSGGEKPHEATELFIPVPDEPPRTVPDRSVLAISLSACLELRLLLESLELLLTGIKLFPKRPVVSLAFLEALVLFLKVSDAITLENLRIKVRYSIVRCVCSVSLPNALDT